MMKFAVSNNLIGQIPARNTQITWSSETNEPTQQELFIVLTINYSIFNPSNPSVDVSVLNKARRSMDFEALEMGKGLSGCGWEK